MEDPRLVAFNQMEELFVYKGLIETRPLDKSA